MIYTFYFPLDYRHGIPSRDRFHISRVDVGDIQIVPRDQSLIDVIFMKTDLYEIFKYLSFEYYVRWDEVFYNVFVARPRISYRGPDEPCSDRTWVKLLP